MYEYKINNIIVIDGDTIDCDIDLGFDVVLKKQRVRFEGIDTPESRTSDVEEKKFGLAAKHKLEEFICSAKSTVLVCKKYDSKEKFGRILGDIYADGISAVAKLIVEGYGVAYNGQRKDLVTAEHMKNRKKLISEGKVSVD